MQTLVLNELNTAIYIYDSQTLVRFIVCLAVNVDSMVYVGL